MSQHDQSFVLIGSLRNSCFLIGSFQLRCLPIGQYEVLARAQLKEIRLLSRVVGPGLSELISVKHLSHLNYYAVGKGELPTLTNGCQIIEKSFFE